MANVVRSRLSHEDDFIPIEHMSIGPIGSSFLLSTGVVGVLVEVVPLFDSAVLLIVLYRWPFKDVLMKTMIPLLSCIRRNNPYGTYLFRW